MRAPRKTGARTPKTANGNGASSAPRGDGHLPDELMEFVSAIDEYKRQNQRPFPTWSEVLQVLKSLGYRKSA